MAAESSRSLVMLDKRNSPLDQSQAPVYQIRIEGHLGQQWTEWFGNLTITPEANGETLVTGPVIDQAALHGLLRKVRDLGMPLVSVVRLSPSPATSEKEG